jgi:hypothetical protein
VLDRAFGPRPDLYLETLGRLLDPAVEIMWTGEEVCSREISPGHIERVAQQIGRKPFLWDNYPVNDGPRMSQHLHLRAFTGRPASLAGHISAHAVNPASQARLSLIPALTLAMSYAEGDRYSYGAAFDRAANALLGADLARRLRFDLLTFQDRGRDRIAPERRAELRAIYAGFAIRLRMRSSRGWKACTSSAKKKCTRNNQRRPGLDPGQGFLPDVEE